jgi:hypothetical protein
LTWAKLGSLKRAQQKLHSLKQGGSLGQTMRSCPTHDGAMQQIISTNWTVDSCWHRFSVFWTSSSAY